MTVALRIHGGELPSTSGVRPPGTTMLYRLRPGALTLLRGWYHVEIHGGENVPAEAPVVMAANHVGWLDGPLLAIASPPPVHALTKQEMFDGSLGSFLLAAGQIPLDRHSGPALDPHRPARAGARPCRRRLPRGGPGHRRDDLARSGAAYLGLVSGAPVVPVSFLGTRVPGGSDGSVPPRGTRIALTFGEPVQLEPQPWPRTEQQVAHAAAQVTAGILEPCEPPRRSWA